MVRYRPGGIGKTRAASFFKEAKAAALQLRSPPAGEANDMNKKLDKDEKYLSDERLARSYPYTNTCVAVTQPAG